MTPRERALDNVKEIVLGALVGYDAKVSLFGSCATGIARRSSDIDIPIDSKEALPANLISHIRDILEESTIPYDIDVVDMTSASSAIRGRVHHEGVVWKE